MITKEKIKELIQKNAKVYTVSIGDKSTAAEPYINEFNLLDLIESLLYNINLYETKEDAEFFIRYKKIPHTKYLDLPSFDEMQEILDWKNIMTYEFIGDNDICALVVDKIDNNIQVVGVGGAYDEWDLNKDNYLKACELSRELFLKSR